MMTRITPFKTLVAGLVAGGTIYLLATFPMFGGTDRLEARSLKYDSALIQLIQDQSTGIKSVLQAVNDLNTKQDELVKLLHASDEQQQHTSRTDKTSHRATAHRVQQVPVIRVADVDCSKLFSGDTAEQLRADQVQSRQKSKLSNKSYYKYGTSNCRSMVASRRFIMKPLSQEEAEFPLAFSILIQKNVQQFGRLLRAIYRPQNSYCIHVDKKAVQSVHDAVRAIASCFKNVFIAARSVAVQWNDFTALEAQMICMKILLKHAHWKYFMNLNGQEFPLKTNWDIVKILKVFNGANNLEGTVARRNVDRTSGRLPPPINVTLTKGSVHIAASREYVEFVLRDSTSIEFLNWVKNTSVPDQTYFTSLNFSPQLKVPGAYLGIPETDTKKNLFIARFENWGDGVFKWPCKGQFNPMCVFAVGDLPLLATRPELFASMFSSSDQPLVFDCIEELYYNRTRNQLTGSRVFDTTFYQDLDFVKNHI